MLSEETELNSPDLFRRFAQIGELRSAGGKEKRQPMGHSRTPSPL